MNLINEQKIICNVLFQVLIRNTHGDIRTCGTRTSRHVSFLHWTGLYFHSRSTLPTSSLLARSLSLSSDKSSRNSLTISLRLRLLDHPSCIEVSRFVFLVSLCVLCLDIELFLMCAYRNFQSKSTKV